MPIYYAILTAAGLAALAAAQAGGAPVVFAQFAVGDGGGDYAEPDEAQVALVNEVWRGAVNRVYVHPQQPSWIVVEAMIPAAAGGWDIREAGLISAAGTLLAVGKYPLTTKPAPGSGSEKDLYVRMVLQVSNGGEVVQVIDGSLVMATQDYVDLHAGQAAPHAGHETPAGAQTKVNVHAARIDNPHQVTPAQIGAETPAGALAKVNAAITALVNASPLALDTLAEIAAALGNDPNFATTIINALAAKETPAGAEAKVDAHAAVTSTHGATAAATPSRLMLRDAAGRCAAVSPAAAGDVATKGYVDAAVPKRYRSPAFVWVNSSLISFNHNIGEPKKAYLAAKCIAAEFGYSVNDWAFNLCWSVGAVAYGEGPYTVRANGIAVSISTPGTHPAILNHIANGGYTLMTPARWHFYLFVEA